MSGTNFVFMSFLFEAIQGSVKVCVCETHYFDFGQITHLSTSNGKLLNSKLLGLIKTYISYMDHIFIRINLIESEARVFKFEDGLWSNDGENDLEWKSFEYQVVRAHQYPNFLYRPFFHLEKFM